MLITASHITKYNNLKCIVDDVSFTINEQDKIALIGVNGTGKSTLLKMISDRENYQGDILKKKDIQISYLSQNPHFQDDYSVLKQVYEYVGHDIPDYEVKAILNKFGITNYEQRIKELSGGQQKRVALAITLLKPCDLLLLDEPTNHLDNEMIEYLERYLIKFNKAIFMVTHDRYFLERITNKIFELDRTKIYEYEANYSHFLELKAQREEIALSTQRKRKLFLKKELEWVRAGVQARTTKSKDRLQRFEELSKVKDVEVNGKVEMIHTFSRLGKKTIELHEISKSFEQKKLFDEFSYMFKQHDRIGILGDNGTGKSTLLNIITGNLKSDMGYVEIGETVRFGYFKQGYDDLPMNKKVIDYIQEISNDFKVDGQGLSAKDMLERFLFDSRLQHTPISRLSGGERRRLYLLRVLMMMPNVLVLDEPTNDLDIDTLNILEDYLDNFEGIIMTVSHDRYFLDRICDGLFILQNQHLRYVNGGYSQNLDTTTKEEKEKSQGALAYKQSKQKKIKMTYMEKKEFEEIEDIIMDLETNLSQIEEKMNGVTDFKKIDKLSKQRDDLQKQIDEKNERYLYLLELQEQIDNQ